MSRPVLAAQMVVRLIADINIPSGWGTLASQKWPTPNQLPAGIVGRLVGVDDEKAEVHFPGYGIVADIPVTALEPLESQRVTLPRPDPRLIDYAGKGFVSDRVPVAPATQERIEEIIRELQLLAEEDYRFGDVHQYDLLIEAVDRIEAWITRQELLPRVRAEPVDE